MTLVGGQFAGPGEVGFTVFADEVGVGPPALLEEALADDAGVGVPDPAPPVVPPSQFAAVVFLFDRAGRLGFTPGAGALFSWAGDALAGSDLAGGLG